MEKDVENNVVFVSRNYFSVDKRRRLFRVGSLRWFGGSRPMQITKLQCKVIISVCNYNNVVIPFSFVRQSLIQLGTKNSDIDCKWKLLKGHLKFHKISCFFRHSVCF